MKIWTNFSGRTCRRSFRSSGNSRRRGAELLAHVETSEKSVVEADNDPRGSFGPGRIALGG